MSAPDKKQILNTIKGLVEKNLNNTWGGERNFCFHLACDMKREFKDRDVDIEVEKRGRKRPDILIHKRGTDNYNLIAFEVNIDNDFSRIEMDVGRLVELFLIAKDYQYSIMIALNISDDNMIKLLKYATETFEKHKSSVKADKHPVLFIIYTIGESEEVKEYSCE